MSQLPPQNRWGLGCSIFAGAYLFGPFAIAYFGDDPIWNSKAPISTFLAWCFVCYAIIQPQILAYLFIVIAGTFAAIHGVREGLAKTAIPPRYQNTLAYIIGGLIGVGIAYLGLYIEPRSPWRTDNY